MAARTLTSDLPGLTPEVLVSVHASLQGWGTLGVTLDGDLLGVDARTWPLNPDAAAVLEREGVDTANHFSVTLEDLQRIHAQDASRFGADFMACPICEAERAAEQ